MMSTVPSRATRATHVTRAARASSIRQTREQLAMVPTQPLPALALAPARPFVVTRSAPSRVSERPRAAGAGIPLAVWLGVFGLLNAADILSTWVGLASGMHEGNPLMSMLLSHFGFGSLIAYKLAVVIAVCAGVLLLRSFGHRAARVTIGICNVLVALVVFTNLAQFALAQ